MKELIAKRRTERGVFLGRLYEVTDGSVSEFVEGYKLGEALGIGKDELRRHLEYFVEKGWIVVDDFRTGIVRLTAAGIDRVEDAVESESGG